jgi:uncharacterized damage-inducible protein DinB
MYRTVQDFLNDWSRATDATIKVLESLTDEKLGQNIVPGHNTLGWLGWHLVTSISYFASQVGLQVPISGDVNSIPDKASQIVEAYKAASRQLEAEVKGKFTNDHLVEEVESLGRLMPRGDVLRILLDHQTHHRGQMTVLIRQAGLKVPGIMGPTKEDQEK